MGNLILTRQPANTKQNWISSDGNNSVRYKPILCNFSLLCFLQNTGVGQEGTSLMVRQHGKGGRRLRRRPLLPSQFHFCLGRQQQLATIKDFGLGANFDPNKPVKLRSKASNDVISMYVWVHSQSNMSMFCLNKNHFSALGVQKSPF